MITSFENFLKKNIMDLFFKIKKTAGEGFEPSQTEPESVVLPLH